MIPRPTSTTRESSTEEGLELDDVDLERHGFKKCLENEEA